MGEKKADEFDFSKLHGEELGARHIAALLRSFHEQRVSSALLMAADQLVVMADKLSEANATILALRAKRRD